MLVIAFAPAFPVSRSSFAISAVCGIALRGRAERFDVYALLDGDPGATSADARDVLYDRDAPPSS